jgi:Lrp/AsnC family transcriptional regulator, leucine-responsive regulatory protein
MIYKLDLKDKKLLYELDTNSRQSFNELSRKLKLSKTAVTYRINNLKKEGIIKQFQTVINFGKLEFIGFRLYLKLQGTTPRKKEEIIEFFKKKDIVAWAVSIEGEYDLGFLILAKTIKEMSDLWDEILERYVNFIKERFLAIMTHVSYFSRAYLLDLKHNNYEIDLITEPENPEIDQKDKEILKLMAPDGRISIIDLSSKVKLTPKTVIQRIKKLEEKKIIVGYRTLFDLEKLGYKYFKVHFKLINITKENGKKFRLFVKSNPNIVYDDKVLGGDDLEIELQVKDLNDLRSILDKIYGEFAEIIREHKVMQYYKEHKFLLFPPNI